MVVASDFLKVRSALVVAKWPLIAPNDVFQPDTSLLHEAAGPDIITNGAMSFSVPSDQHNSRVLPGKDNILLSPPITLGKHSPQCLDLIPILMLSKDVGLLPLPRDDISFTTLKAHHSKGGTARKPFATAYLLPTLVIDVETDSLADYFTSKPIKYIYPSVEASNFSLTVNSPTTLSGFTLLFHKPDLPVLDLPQAPLATLLPIPILSLLPPPLPSSLSPYTDSALPNTSRYSLRSTMKASQLRGLGMDKSPISPRLRGRLSIMEKS